jgi:hypothetical protein
MNVILSDLRVFSTGYSVDRTLGLFSEARIDEVTIQEPEVSPPTTSARLNWARPALQRILQLAMLRKNWDGRGSERVSPDVLAFVVALLAQTMPPNARPPNIVPLGAGGVQLIWATSRVELEIEVPKPNEVYVFLLDRVTGSEREFRATTQFNEVSGIIWGMFQE